MIGSSEDFITRDCCGNWPTWLVTEYVMSANMITAAYLAVAFIIVHVFVFEKKVDRVSLRIKSKWRVYASFASFFVLCGLGHQEKCLAFVWPNYYFFAHWEFATAVTSWWGVWELFRNRLQILKVL